MFSLKNKRTEYGGYLPLELNPGVEFFSKYEKFLSRFNSVKAALSFLIAKLDIKDIYIPYYYCPTTTEVIVKFHVNIHFYHIDQRLAPIDFPDNNDSVVLLVNYFGVCDKLINDFVKKICHAKVIVDNAHAFYKRPILKRHVYNVYSAKKFFGVPDGSYLVSCSITPNEDILTNSCDYAGYLISAYERGVNSSYVLKKNTDVNLVNNFGCMSKLTVGLLQNVNYKMVNKVRRSNYKFLHSTFKSFNELKLPRCVPAYQYPLLISKYGVMIKQFLIQNNIFVSTLWSSKELIENGNEFEINMKDNCIFLPIDQRYDDKDMYFITNTVYSLLKKYDSENR